MDYPIGSSISEILTGYAARSLSLARRETEARTIAGKNVRLISQPTSSRFEDEASLITYYEQCHPGLLLEGFARPQCRKDPAAKPSKPPTITIEDPTRRWTIRTPSSVYWCLSLTFWQVEAEAAPRPSPPSEPARRLRTSSRPRELSPDALKALTDQPLAPLHPQKALDIGLFEIRAPENQGLILPDE